uniref:Uncharacterized protein n=1 Tax=Nelumbo nucifera TaxID=4432 RepID=A0A822Y4Q7_NELNU|nr:TPA_asm: hypothetical protein HUJ06_028069 [Nelumbo nucifera]
MKQPIHLINKNLIKSPANIHFLMKQHVSDLTLCCGRQNLTIQPNTCEFKMKGKFLQFKRVNKAGQKHISIHPKLTTKHNVNKKIVTQTPDLVYTIQDCTLQQPLI